MFKFIVFSFVMCFDMSVRRVYISLNLVLLHALLHAMLHALLHALSSCLKSFTFHFYFIIKKACKIFNF